MLQQTEDQILIQHDSGAWTAIHGTSAAPGPATLECGNEPLLQDCTFYVDDLTPENALPQRCKAYHRGGAAVVETRGYFPFGERLKYQQSCRYAQNHLRVAFDLRWPRAFELKRHLGIGSMVLPGAWRRVYVFPPARHLAEGAEPGWKNLPAAPGHDEKMIAHWHRPPLAVVFERSDGARIEIGTGGDLWRWNSALGYGPESGSYKVFLNADGLRFVREPLMCCEPFTPRSQLYRFKWYAAWQAAGSIGAAPRSAGAARIEFDPDGKLLMETIPGKPQAFILDFDALEWPTTAYRATSQAAYLRAEQDPHPCWQSNATRNLARTVIRQIKERLAPARLFIKGVNPAPCWDPAHLDRSAADGLPHWDMTDILDFSVWARRQLDPDWEILPVHTADQPLPSLAGLFQPNGFDPAAF